MQISQPIDTAGDDMSDKQLKQVYAAYTDTWAVYSICSIRPALNLCLFSSCTVLPTQIAKPDL